MPFLLCYELVSDKQLWAVANGDNLDDLKKHISSYAGGTTFSVFEVPADFNFKQRLAPPVGDLAPVYTWSEGQSGEDKKFLETPVVHKAPGGKAQLEFTLALEGLDAVASPVVGFFDEDGNFLGRTEIIKNTKTAVFQKPFEVFGNPKDGLELNFSVYDASKEITKDTFVGCASVGFKTALGASTQCTLHDNSGVKVPGSLSLIKKARAKKEKAPQQQKKKKKGKSKKDDAPLDEKAIAKKFAKALKEGGKKGQDISGLSEMGGVSFWHVSLDSVGADWALMDEALKGFNKEVDEAAEDRKGGAGKLGKMLFGYDLEQLIFMCHLPENLHEKVKIDDWVKIVVDSTQGTIIESSPTIVKGYVMADPDKNRYPIKMRDEAISQAYTWLTKQHLVIAEEDSDEIVYGDDDFPDYY